MIDMEQLAQIYIYIYFPRFLFCKLKKFLRKKTVGATPKIDSCWMATGKYDVDRPMSLIGDLSAAGGPCCWRIEHLVASSFTYEPPVSRVEALWKQKRSSPRKEKELGWCPTPYSPSRLRHLSPADDIPHGGPRHKQQV